MSSVISLWVVAVPAVNSKNETVANERALKGIITSLVRGHWKGYEAARSSLED